MEILEKFSSKNKDPYLSVYFREFPLEKNEIPHYKVVYDNQAQNIKGVPHIKMIWDNKLEKKIEIWVNGELSAL